MSLSDNVDYVYNRIDESDKEAIYNEEDVKVFIKEFKVQVVRLIGDEKHIVLKLLDELAGEKLI